MHEYVGRFVMLRVVPGNLAEILVYQSGRESSAVQPKQIRQIRTELGLDRPLIVQVPGLARRRPPGDFGYSYTQRQPVTEVLIERLSRAGRSTR